MGRNFFLAAVLVFLTGCFAGEVRAESPAILFDQGHGQRFLVEKKGDLDLSGLARILQSHGLTVGYRRHLLDSEALKDSDGLVISGPFAPFGDGEVAAIGEFLERGGRLCVMLHIGQPLLPLLEALGISVSKGVVNEGVNLTAASPLDFQVTRLESHPIHEGLVSYALYGAWGLEAANRKARIIARTGPGAWIDRDRDRTLSPDEPAGETGVVAAGEVGKGAFVVFGDDAVFQNRFLKEGNLVLAVNLARWLAGD
jgi:hypothetical protein